MAERLFGHVPGYLEGSLFDNGAVSVADDLSLIGAESTLTVHGDHHINQNYLAYHREHFVVALKV